MNFIEFAFLQEFFEFNFFFQTKCQFPNSLNMFLLVVVLLVNFSLLNNVKLIYGTQMDQSNEKYKLPTLVHY